jgi:hypothetical protein
MAEDFESTSPEGQAEAAGKAVGEAFRPPESTPDEVPSALPSDAAETDDGEVGLYERARLNHARRHGAPHLDAGRQYVAGDEADAGDHAEGI